MNSMFAARFALASCTLMFLMYMLCMLVPSGLFVIIIFTNQFKMLTIFCAGPQWAGIQSARRIMLLTVLLALLDCALVVTERALVQAVPADQFLTTDILSIFPILFGIATTTSSLAILALNNNTQEAATSRRLGRRIRKMTWWAPQAKLQLCDDFSFAQGECAICLEELADLPAADSYAPASGCKSLSNIGLLRLPCTHVFHGYCAEHWIAREVSCPLCRQPVGSLGKCVRLCLRPPPAAGPAKSSAGAAGASVLGAASAEGERGPEGEEQSSADGDAAADAGHHHITL